MRDIELRERLERIEGKDMNKKSDFVSKPANHIFQEVCDALGITPAQMSAMSRKQFEGLLKRGLKELHRQQAKEKKAGRP